MDIRAEVWSPLQNTAVWLGAWLHGHTSSDETIAALQALGGTHQVIDETGSHPLALIELLSQLRHFTSAAIAEGGEPILRLILAGPGDPPSLPAGSAAAKALEQANNAALVVRCEIPEEFLILIPSHHEGLTTWRIIEHSGWLPAPAWLSPGEADALLSEATEESARLIEDSHYRTEAPVTPRLTVGTLADFYDTFGLPPAVPNRAAKLFARADRVAAIIETVVQENSDHSIDPQLFRLWRHVRSARIAGVAYALTEFGR